MKVEQGKKVTIEYELAVDGGDVLESSEGRGPLEYVHGGGAMLKGLEDRMDGMGQGEEKEGVIPAAEAYGTEETLPTTELPRSEFPEDVEVEVGKSFEAKDQAGNPVKFTAIEVDDEQVTVRFEHPLAGKDIRFKVKVLEIADAD